jgi:hypothetical protein
MRRRSREDEAWGGWVEMGCVMTGTALPQMDTLNEVSRAKDLLEARAKTRAGGNITTSNGLGSLSASARRRVGAALRKRRGAVCYAVASTRKLDEDVLFWRGYGWVAIGLLYDVLVVVMVYFIAGQLVVW